MSVVAVGHIEVDERGVARIAGTRSRVINVVLDTRSGLTPPQIQREYPHLSLAQIHAALAYYYDHQPEIDSAIERELRDAAELRAKTPGPSREELLARAPRPHVVD
jgi:uncharacterized protein (DUF433 family)